MLAHARPRGASSESSDMQMLNHIDSKCGQKNDHTKFLCNYFTYIANVDEMRYRVTI